MLISYRGSAGRSGAGGQRLTVFGLALLLAAFVLLAGGAAARAKSSRAAVSVFPVPGDLVASPKAQITFRGLPASQLGTIQVAGSRTGVHSGVIESDSDGNGGSFVPNQPFDPGEEVTVTTSLNILGAAHPGVFHFAIAYPASPGSLGWPLRAPRVPGDVWSFHSRPDLAPAAVTIHRRGAGGGSSDIFLTPQYGPVQDGEEIVDPTGRLIWFNPLPRQEMAADLQVQQYKGQPVLTWWQGASANGMGIGEDLIYNSSYQQVATVQAGNGLSADLHEFQLTPQGTALITAFNPVYWNATSVHGSRRQIVFDCAIQEIDISTGLVLYQWDSLDHVPISASYQPVTGRGGPWDYFHINSIQLDQDGNLLISARNTWAAYKVDHRTGKVYWTLGGKQSSFRMVGNAGFAFQHDVEARSAGDTWLTVFDDGGGKPDVHLSRGLELFLSFKWRTARTAAQWGHSPPLMAEAEGNVQQLVGYHFIGWGEQPYFTEYDRRGRVILDGRFVSQTASYRAYRFPWSGTPATPPALVASQSGGNMTLYMSWNGATGVASWRVLGGSSTAALRTLATVQDTSFETTATVPQQRYAEVQALDSHGNVLGSSAPVTVG